MVARVFKTAARALARSSMFETWDLFTAATGQFSTVRVHDVRTMDIRDNGATRQVISEARLIMETAAVDAMRTYDRIYAPGDRTTPYEVFDRLDLGGGHTQVGYRFAPAVQYQP